MCRYIFCRAAKITLCKFHVVKNWYQFLTAREKLVPMRHVFHTNISHFVKNAHVVKLYVAYMRFLHIDKISPKYAAVLPLILYSIPCMALFNNWRGSNRLLFVSFTIQLKQLGQELEYSNANQLYQPRRKKLFF